jgi:serine/threonine protein kinase
MSERSGQRTIGRYAMCAEIAAGGMATVHLGKLLGPVGFSRIVAIKALHPQFAKDPDFLSMFLDEARLAGRIRHPNVVSVFDVVSRQGELFLVMDYVPGETLARLARAARAQNERVPLPVALAVVAGALDGLHAAHEAKDESGAPLGIVHRDVSPQNILVGTDGAARILDFGVAKAVGRMQATRGDQLKGKLAYMAPEQLMRGPLDRGADVYAASIVLWELLTRERLFQGDDEISTYKLALDAVVRPPSEVLAELPQMLDAIVLKGLARNREDRFSTARDMARALEATGLLASDREVGDWVERVAQEPLASRARRLAQVEQGSSSGGEQDPEQARDDASLMRKIDRRGAAEAATMIVDSPPEDESSGALAAPAARAAPRRRSALLIGALACLLFASALLLVRVSRQNPSPPPVQGVIAAPIREAPTSNAPAAIAPPVLPLPLAADSAAPALPKARPAPHIAQTPRPVAKSKTDCSVPFTIDDHGVRIPKRQCL